MRKLVLAVLLLPLFASGGAIKSWSPGEVFDVTSLNANFAHIHSTMVGGHGARLTNSDVASGAAIAHSKLAAPGLIPKSLVMVGVTPATNCAASPCSTTTLAGFSPTTVTRLGAGAYTVTFAARPNANYMVSVSSSNGANYCVAVAYTTTTFTVGCYNGAGVQVDAAFQYVFYDDNN